MAQPSSALATLRPDLASMFEFDLEMDRQGFIAYRVAPVIQVNRQSGNFGKIPIEQLLVKRSTERAPGASYRRGDWEFTPDTFATQEHGAEEVVDDRESAMYIDYFDHEMVSTMRAVDIIARNAEMRVAAQVFNATTFASQLTNITNEWDDFSNADPVANVDTACKAVWGRTGVWPNALVVNRHVFKNLRQCDNVVDKIHSSGAGSSIVQGNITAQMLASVFDLDFVIVAGSAKNTADEGQSVTIDKIWSDEYAAVLKIPTSADIREPAAFRTFHWSGDGSNIGGTVESYRDETVRGEVIRVRHDVQEKNIYTEMVQLLDNVTTI